MTTSAVGAGLSQQGTLNVAVGEFTLVTASSATVIDALAGLAFSGSPKGTAIGGGIGLLIGAVGGFFVAQSLKNSSAAATTTS